MNAFKKYLLYLLIVPLFIIILLIISIEGFNFVGEKIGFIGKSFGLKSLHTFIRESGIPSLPYELIPGIQNDKWGIKVNSLGFRSDEIKEQKDIEEIRIIVLGDSVTMGILKGNSNTYPAILQKLLRQQGKLNKIKKKINVINMGVGGYNTCDELSILKHKGIQLKPDIIILGYVVNDLDGCNNHMYSRKNTIPNKIRKWGAINLKGLYKIYIKVLKVIRVIKEYRQIEDDNKYLSIETKMRDEKKQKVDVGNRVAIRTKYMMNLYYHNPKQYLRHIYALNEIKEIALKKNIPLIIAQLPILDWGPNASLNDRSINLENNLEYDINSSLKKIFDRVIFYRKIMRNLNPADYRPSTEDPIHLNLKGSEVVANVLFEYIVRNTKIFNPSNENSVR